MKTTYRKLKNLCPCLDGCKNYCTKIFGENSIDQDKEITIREILKKSEFYVENVLWALRTQEYRDICLLFAEIAEGVLSLFEAVFPADKAPKNAIDGIRLWHDGKITDKELSNLSKLAEKSTHEAYCSCHKKVISFKTSAFYAAWCATAASDADSFFTFSLSPIDISESSNRAALMRGIAYRQIDQDGFELYTLKKLHNSAIIKDFLEVRN